MSTLAPKMSTQIDYERPVGAAPSVLEAVLGTVSGLATDYVNNLDRSGPSAQDVKNAALSPFVAELNRIADMNITQQEKNRLSDSAYRSFIQGNPAFASDARSIKEGDFGFEAGQGDFRRMVEDDSQRWLSETPEGRLAAVKVAQMVGQGTISSEESWQVAMELYQEDQALKARISRFANTEKDGEAKWSELSGSWTKRSMDIAASDAVAASTNPELVKDPLRAMEVLDDRINSVRNQIRSEALAAGISPAVLEAKVEEVIKPLVDLRTVWQQEMENPGKLLAATRAMDELGLREKMVESFGIVGTDPKFREAFLTFLSQETWTRGNAEKFLDGVMKGDIPAQFDLGVDLPPGINQAAANPSTVTTPEKVSEFKTRIKNNPDALPQHLAFSATKLRSDDPAVVQQGLNGLVLAGEAYEGAIGVNTLRQLFNPATMAKLKDLDETDKATLASFVMTQVRRNRALVAGSGDLLLRDQRVREVGGRFVVERKALTTGKWEQVTGDSELVRSVKAVNYLMDITAKVPDINKQVTNSVNWLYRGVDPTPEQLEEDISWSDLENVQHTSASAPNNLVALIDKTEGGGRYDTLFGHSQRSGGQFAGVDVSTMSIGQVLEFQNPSGPYGQWVKKELGESGQRARVATPAGRYQYVGTTLAAMVKEMGIPLNTTFNKQTQDAIFDYHVRKIIAGKSDIAAAQALRGTWEGFQSIGDAELANAVAAFRGTPPRDYGNLPTGGAVSPTQERTFTEMLAAFEMESGATASGFEVSATMFNPATGDTERDSVDTEDARRGSRVAAREARTLIVTQLKQAGYTDAEVAEIMANEEA